MQKTLLLIDSSQVLMEITKKIFERDGYAVHCGVGFAGARELLMDYYPDGIVLDGDLPDGSGFELCLELRSNSDIPIMFTSVNKEDELLALQYGASDFLKKPYDFDIMKARIGVMLNTKLGYSADADEEEEGSPAAIQDNVGFDIDVKRPESTFKQPRGGIRYRMGLSLAAAACVLVIIAGAGVYNSVINRSGYTEIAEGTVPLAALLPPEENAKPYAGGEVGVIDGPGFRIPDYHSAVIHGEPLRIRAPLFNPEGNSQDLAFEVQLAGSGDPIYRSGLIGPGQGVESFAPAEPLEAGEYVATLIIHAYTSNGVEEQGAEKAEFILRIK